MRQVGPDHMQSADLTQPQQNLCTITMSGRRQGVLFVSSSMTKVNNRGGQTNRVNSGNTRVHDTEKWRKSACLWPRALNVSQSSDA